MEPSVSAAKVRVLSPDPLPMICSGAVAVPPRPGSKVSAPPSPPLIALVSVVPVRESSKALPTTTVMWLRVWTPNPVAVPVCRLTVTPDGAAA